MQNRTIDFKNLDCKIKCFLLRQPFKGLYDYSYIDRQGKEFYVLSTDVLDSYHETGDIKLRKDVHKQDFVDALMSANAKDIMQELKPGVLPEKVLDKLGQYCRLYAYFFDLQNKAAVTLEYESNPVYKMVYLLLRAHYSSSRLFIVGGCCFPSYETFNKLNNILEAALEICDKQFNLFPLVHTYDATFFIPNADIIKIGEQIILRAKWANKSSDVVINNCFFNEGPETPYKERRIDYKLLSVEEGVRLGDFPVNVLDLSFAEIWEVTNFFATDHVSLDGKLKLFSGNKHKFFFGEKGEISAKDLMYGKIPFIGVKMLNKNIISKKLDWNTDIL